MRIAVFSRSTHYHFESGGMETQLKNLVEGLTNSGHDIVVITTALPYEKHSIDKTIRENGIDYVFIANTTPGLYPLNLLERIWLLTGQLRRRTTREGRLNYFRESKKVFARHDLKKRFDLVISQSTAARGFVYSTNLPVLSVIHGTISAEIMNRLKANRTFKNWARFFVLDLPSWYFEKYTSNKRFFNRVEQVILVSYSLRTQFLKEYPMYAYKTHVIHNGIDEHIFHTGKSKYETFTILYAGRIDREKGIDILLKVVRKLVQDGCKIRAKIVGDGVHFKEMKKYAKKLGIKDFVDFVGAVPNKKLVKYYQKCHVFVLPTRREEGHPMIISEAFCSGLPVIATRKGGLVDIISPGKTGYLIDDNNVYDFARKIKELYQNPKNLVRMSKNARKTGKEKYSRSVMISKYAKILTSF